MSPLLHIDDIIEGAAADTGFSVETCRIVLGAALGLLDKHGDPKALDPLYRQFEGARLLIDTSEIKPRGGGGLFGGMMRSAGGLSGKAMADAMGVFDALKARGIGKPELKRILSAARRRVIAATGHDLIGDATASVPGVGALMGADG